MKIFIVLIVTLLTLSSICFGSQIRAVEAPFGGVGAVKMKAFDKTQLEITPKPANERATIKIQLDDIKEGVQLKIIDARGVEQRSYPIQDRYTSIEVDTKAFTSGIYICIVMQDSKILLKSTLNITH